MTNTKNYKNTLTFMEIMMSKQFYKEELGKMIAENSKLKQEILDLTMEISELKDEIRNHNQYAETDGYEVGSPSDYEISNQLEINFGKEKNDR